MKTTEGTLNCTITVSAFISERKNGKWVGERKLEIELNMKYLKMRLQESQNT